MGPVTTGHAHTRADEARNEPEATCDRSNAAPRPAAADEPIWRVARAPLRTPGAGGGSHVSKRIDELFPT